MSSGVRGVVVTTLVVVAMALVGSPAGADRGDAQARAQVSGVVRAVSASWSARVLKLTNKERAKRGLRPLVASPCAGKFASRWAKRLARTGKFEHQDLSGVMGCPRVWAAGENIAYGFNEPQDVVAAWMASPGHRAIILDPKYTQLGIGGFTGNDGAVYWVQDFVSTGR